MLWFWQHQKEVGVVNTTWCLNPGHILLQKASCMLQNACVFNIWKNTAFPQPFWSFCSFCNTPQLSAKPQKCLQRSFPGNDFGGTCHSMLWSMGPQTILTPQWSHHVLESCGHSFCSTLQEAATMPQHVVSIFSAEQQKGCGKPAVCSGKIQPNQI